MNPHNHHFLSIIFGAFVLVPLAHAQFNQEPGKSIGTISTQGDLIIMKLNEGALGKSNMFDLDHRTLRFTPDSGGYRVENAALQWDSEFGAEIASPQFALHNFAFPFSGKDWDSLSIGLTGSIRFGAAPEAAGGRGPGFGGRGGGVSIARFDQLQDAARHLINTVPAICVFFKPRMSGHRYAKELDDRVVITWDLTEPFGNIQDFTWTPTVNRFQVVLRRDGTIEMSYNQLTAKDAIVGVYPMVQGGPERTLGTIESVRLSASGPLLKLTFVTRPAVEGVLYRIHFTGAHKSAEAVWTVRTAGRGGLRYVASGVGVSPGVKVDGETLSIQGILPPGLAEPVSVSADGIAGEPVNLSGWHSPEVHFSSLKPQDGPFPIVYESFHYTALPNPRDLTCTVIKALGDKFDFLAYYSEFRVDNQEAGTPSSGPLGGNVTGIGQTMRDLGSYCSAGRFQWQFIQPVYVNAIQTQERPPEGVTTPNNHDIAYYTKQLSLRSTDGKIPPYNYGLSQIAHEMGHRWSAFVSVKINGETIPLGPTHWARGLQAPVAFPYQRPTEASIMGGSVWQDNLDGTYTQLDDDYYVPVTGWSYLDLYLMGLITPEEVPDFFILRNLATAGRDAAGRPIVKADRVKVTVKDVIENEGPRLPAVADSQKKFNTGMVILVPHDGAASHEAIERVNGIRERWIDYWSTTTGHRSTMTASPR
jgi:hypothetical protein